MDDQSRKPNHNDNNPDNAGNQNNVGRGKPPSSAKFENKPVTGRIRTRRKPGHNSFDEPEILRCSNP